MTKSKIYLAVATGLLSSFSLSAEQADESPLETLTVVSSRIEVPLKQVSTSIETIDDEYLELAGQLSIADILRTATGINVSNSGGIGKNTTVRIRGEEGFRTKVLIDGVELSDPSAPQVLPLFDDITSSHISRIDILRGPQGLAYGADAGGVIAITSKQAEQGMKISSKAEIGSFDTESFNLNLSAGNENSGAYLGCQRSVYGWLQCPVSRC